MTTAAKFTAAAAAVADDLNAEMAGIPFNEWTANGATTAGAVAPFSLVANEAIDTSVPATGQLTTANGEVLHYSAYVAGTKTFTIDARAQDGTTAAAIDNGSAFGQWITRKAWRQIAAEIIALENALGTPAIRYNWLTNPGFAIWQRGTGAFTASLAYTADRWQIILNGTDTCSVSQETTNKPTDAVYAAACTYVKGTGTTTALRQILKITTDEPQHYALRGKSISLSIAVRTATASAAKAYITTDGTGGTTTLSSFHTGGGTFENLTVAGVVVPSDATSIEVGVRFAASATVYVGNSILAEGSTAPTFRALTPAEDRERCMRYYEVIAGVGTSFNYQFHAGAAAAYIVPVRFAVRKAVAPTVTRVGTWTISNLTGQPSINGTSGVGEFQFRADTSGAGLSGFASVDTTTYVSAEANP